MAQQQPMTADYRDVLFVNYLKETYGQDLQGAMIAGIQASRTNAPGEVAMSTIMNGLIMEQVPNFYSEFESIGGDADYLRYAVECFKQVRSLIVQVQPQPMH